MQEINNQVTPYMKSRAKLCASQNQVLNTFPNRVVMKKIRNVCIGIGISLLSQFVWPGQNCQMAQQIASMDCARGSPACSFQKTMANQICSIESANSSANKMNDAYEGGNSYGSSINYGNSQSYSEQSCTPGPICNAAGARAEPYIQRMQARQDAIRRNDRYGGGAAASAEAAYCVQMVAAETARICGDEMQKMGNRTCADQAYAQSQSLISTAKGALNAANAMSGMNNWRSTCGW